jgi:hypothetical protein
MQKPGGRNVIPDAKSESCHFFYNIVKGDTPESDLLSDLTYLPQQLITADCSMDDGPLRGRRIEIPGVLNDQLKFVLAVEMYVV